MVEVVGGVIDDELVAVVEGQVEEAQEEEHQDQPETGPLVGFQEAEIDPEVVFEVDDLFVGDLDGGQGEGL